MITLIVVCVPAFNEEKTIAKVVLQVGSVWIGLLFAVVFQRIMTRNRGYVEAAVADRSVVLRGDEGVQKV